MWKKIAHHRWIYSFAFAFAFFFIFAFGLSQNTFAVSDRSFTFDSSSSTTVLCDSSNSCSDYSYIIITYNGSSSTSDVFQLSFYTAPSSYKYTVFPGFTSVLEFPGSSYIQVRAYPTLSTISSASSFTVTLSENNPYAGGITPSGSLSITENGTYDVTNYAEAVVDVPSVGGDYSDDLQDVKNAILIGTASLFVIYFFWAIYKMIMGAIRR